MDVVAQRMRPEPEPWAWEGDSRRGVIEIREGSICRDGEDLVKIDRAEEAISEARDAGRPATYALWAHVLVSLAL